MRCVHENKSQQELQVSRGFRFRRYILWDSAGSRSRIVRSALIVSAALIPMSGVISKTPSASAAELAPIAVSLVVQETCEIRSTVSAQTIAMPTLPSVSCLHGAASVIERSPVDPTQPLSTLETSTQAASPAVLTVAF